jgi:hypothetical protein
MRHRNEGWLRHRDAVTWTHLHVGFGEVGDGRPLCNPALPVRDDLESEPRSTEQWKGGHGHTVATCVCWSMTSLTAEAISDV